MDLKQLGIDPIRGGCAVVVTGEIIKNEPWSRTDEKTGEYREGHSLQVAYFGGVFKVKTEADDPLRKQSVGTAIALLVPVSDSGYGIKQSGPATLLDLKQAPVKAGAA